MGEPDRSAVASTPRNAPTSTPLGISTAPDPRASICHRRARVDTAIRPRIFSRSGARAPSAAPRIIEPEVDVWKVAVMGPEDMARANIPTPGALGSWMCNTSSGSLRNQ